MVHVLPIAGHLSRHCLNFPDFGFIVTFSVPQIFSIGLRSGLWLGKSRTQRFPAKTVICVVNFVFWGHFLLENSIRTYSVLFWLFHLIQRDYLFESCYVLSSQHCLIFPCEPTATFSIYPISCILLANKPLSSVLHSLFLVIFSWLCIISTGECQTYLKWLLYLSPHSSFH